MTVMEDLRLIEDDLCSLDRAVRDGALARLIDLDKQGALPAPAPTGRVNLHLHTTFSFNAENYGPGRIAWEARKAGLEVVGTVDFDVLDAMEEIFAAGDALGIPAVAAMESRVFVADYADKEINSPGEPGVSYFMGTGFTALPPTGSPAAATLDDMRARARVRNERMLARVNDHLDPVRIDYAADVLPLTPSGNATERHLLAAYDGRARQVFPDATALAAFWSEKLGLSADEVAPLLGDTAKLRNTIRAKLMKRGGVGYSQPDASTFPPLETVIDMIVACEAIPCTTWLDGTSGGEADAETLLDDFLAKGCIALNIIPDRNWNIADAETKAVKVEKLNAICAAARARHLILSVGTEMNNYGLPFVDNFDAPEMRPHADLFREGARILYGHTLLQRAAGLGRMSAWARDAFGDNRAAANAFYCDAGRRHRLPDEVKTALDGLANDAAPKDVLARLA